MLEEIFARLDKKIERSYFIVDPTHFFSEEILCRLKEKFLKTVTKDNFRIFDSGGLEEQALFQLLNTPSLFSPKRLWVFRGADKLKKGIIDILVAGLQEETKESCLIFMADKKLNHALFQFCKKSNFLLEFKKPFEAKIPYWIQWISKKKHKKIETKVALLLMGKVGMDLAQLSSEMEKLSTFVGDKSEITEEDVRMLFYSTRSHSIFELTSAIGHQKKGEVGAILEKILQEGESEVFILGMIVWHLRNLWKAVEWKGQKSDAEIQRLLGIHPVFWEDFRRQRELFMRAPFESYWKKALEIDCLLKTSTLDKRNLLFQFALMNLQ